jgi:hypothetical protein
MKYLHNLFLSLLILPALLNGASFGEQGHHHYYNMRFKNALYSYQLGLEHAIKTANAVKEVIYLNNISSIFHAINRPDSCRHYLDLAHGSCGASLPLLTLVAINRQTLDPGSGVDIDEKNLFELEKILSGTDYSAVLTAYGKIKLEQGKKDLARALFKKARKSGKKNKKSTSFANACFYLAKTETLDNSPKKALGLLEEAEKIYRGRDFIYGIKKCLKLKKEIFRQLSDPAAVARIDALIQRMPSAGIY